MVGKGIIANGYRVSSRGDEKVLELDSGEKKKKKKHYDLQR